jgi:hypothetical protein
VGGEDSAWGGIVRVRLVAHRPLGFPSLQQA